MTTTTDIKPLAEQLERDLLDRPARRFMFWGLALLVGGLFLNLILGDIPGVETEKYDGLAAVAAVIGGFQMVAAAVVRILQRGRREEIRQELGRALAAIEVERARRDMRLMDMVEDLFDAIGRRDARVNDVISRMREELSGGLGDVRQMLQELTLREEKWRHEFAPPNQGESARDDAFVDALSEQEDGPKTSGRKVTRLVRPHNRDWPKRT